MYFLFSLKIKFQNVTEDCEDLNTADESLKKLLYDIQNANLDTCPNDIFADELNESAIKATKASSKFGELSARRFSLYVLITLYIDWCMTEIDRQYKELSSSSCHYLFRSFRE